MTDFGPLLANPKTLLLGAAAQFGIFATFLLTLWLLPMIGMVVTSRLIGRVDQRAMMICGMVAFGFSTYEMSTINLYVDNFTVVRIGLMQGFSMAFVVSPLSIAAFSTLAPRLRTESASMFALMRNIGGSIGVSVLFTRVAQLTQTEHARLGENITPFSDPALLPDR